jgi:hypothetical protein
MGSLIGGSTKVGRGGVGCTGATGIPGLTKPLGTLETLGDIACGEEKVLGMVQVGKTQILKLLLFKLPLNPLIFRLTGCCDRPLSNENGLRGKLAKPIRFSKL